MTDATGFPSSADLLASTNSAPINRAEKIAQRAYDKWMTHCQLKDHELQDWLEAEADLMAEGTTAERGPTENEQFDVGLNLNSRKSASKVGCTVRDVSELKAAEDRLEEFFNLSLDIFCIATLDGFLTKVNHAYVQLLGYSEDELKSRTFFDFFNPEDVARARSGVEKLAAGEFVTEFRCRSRAKDGSDYWIEWNARSVPKQGIIYAVGRNITEHLRFENELKSRENRENALLEHTLAIICIKDLNGRYEFVNKKFAELFSGTRETAIGKTARDFFSEADAARAAAQERMVIQTKETITTSETLQLANGIHTFLSQKFPLFDTSGQVSATASFLTDVTQQLESQKREDEIKVAREFQQHLYPQSNLSNLNFDVVGAAKPATGLCGDYFDYYELGPNCLMVGIGDVSGHGIGPSLQMTKVSCTVQIMARLRYSLPDIMGELNSDLCRTLPDGNFVSVFLAQIDLASHRLSYLGAGHASILVRADGTVLKLDSTHSVLGFEPSATFQEVASVQIEPNDLILFHTDGLNEAMNRERKLYGMRRVTEIVCSHRHERPQKILELLFQAIDEFTEDSTHTDDVTAVIVKLPHRKAAGSDRSLVLARKASQMNDKSDFAINQSTAVFEEPVSLAELSESLDENESPESDRIETNLLKIVRDDSTVNISFNRQCLHPDLCVAGYHDQLGPFLEDPECKVFRFDLTDVHMIVSVMLGFFVSVSKNGKVEIVNPSPEIREMLQIMKLDHFLATREEPRQSTSPR
jgi:PAS domain S-box-containing protein